MKKFSKILMGIKIGAAVGKTIVTGKPSKILNEVDKYANLASAVEELIKNAVDKKKTNG